MTSTEHYMANMSRCAAVTDRENILRGISLSAQRARQTHCKRGHEFTPENTYVNPTGRKRRCLTCFRQWTQARAEATS